MRELTTAQANALRTLFGLAPIDAYGNNPKYFNVDATLQKRVRIRGQSFRVTVEAFNLFNIPQRDQPSQNIFDTSDFGLYSSVDQPRAVQFTFQFDF
ncbi:MAG: TonB-dependent receptor [Acidobacteria bacterium]|nr:TonB-dependent receptor [Acidobacteriota bacterium]MCA1651688.1 TonB-dependent receptor [Acidobacteriota bacterium]